MNIREVEEALMDHPDVAEVCALVMPQPAERKQVKAFVATRGGNPVNAAELLTFAQARVSADTEVVEIAVMTALPRSPLGAVSRRTLAEMLG